MNVYHFFRYDISVNSCFQLGRVDPQNTPWIERIMLNHPLSRIEVYLGIQNTPKLMILGLNKILITGKFTTNH